MHLHARASAVALHALHVLAAATDHQPAVPAHGHLRRDHGLGRPSGFIPRGRDVGSRDLFPRAGFVRVICHCTRRRVVRAVGTFFFALGERVGDVALDGGSPRGDDVLAAPEPHNPRVLVPVHKAARAALRGLDVQTSLAHHLADRVAGHRHLRGGRRVGWRCFGHGRKIREREDCEHLRSCLRHSARRAYQRDVRRLLVTPHLHAGFLLESRHPRAPLADDHAAVLGGALHVLLHVAGAARRTEAGSRVARVSWVAIAGGAVRVRVRSTPSWVVRARAASRTAAGVLEIQHLATQLGDGGVNRRDATLHAHLSGVPDRLAGRGLVNQNMRAGALLQVLDASAPLADDNLRHLRGDLENVLNLAAAAAAAAVVTAAAAAGGRVGVPPVVVAVVVRGRTSFILVPVLIVSARGGERVRLRHRSPRAGRGLRRRRIGDRRAVVRVAAVVPAVPLSLGRIAVPVVRRSVVRRVAPVPRIAAIGAARAVPVPRRVRVPARRAAVSSSVVISAMMLSVIMPEIPVVVMIARRAVPRAHPGVVPAIVPASIDGRVSAGAVPIVAAHRARSAG
mmetsp:Transcript_9253/g.38919  ORF Transcript_9253/g.38919 Transcript_9253/m.38919 type:complete len:566 (-) Transcript_9253:24-1721(-)